MLRNIIITLYGLGCFLAAWLMYHFFRGNSDLAWEWRVDHVAACFIPMLLFMLAVLCTQVRSPKVSWWLIPIVLLAAITLLYSMVSHMYPEESKMYALVHLIFISVSTFFMFKWPQFFGISKNR